MIVDPARDISPLSTRRSRNICASRRSPETHIHADFVSGIREVAAATGAHMYLSAEGGVDWQYQFVDANTALLHDGASWLLGSHPHSGDPYAGARPNT
ncbi:MAG: hypothetical protein IPK17_21670 [Chloroflexi bacterium]|uniref:hypothetical protein n=1 Tax=Candidatus Flexifilum breve TaxID=3140694 RepID=UPI00313769CE|nr:hypothetical protein [Chloroflexota bacterium]